MIWRGGTRNGKWNAWARKRGARPFQPPDWPDRWSIERPWHDRDSSQGRGLTRLRSLHFQPEKEAGSRWSLEGESSKRVRVERIDEARSQEGREVDSRGLSNGACPWERTRREWGTDREGARNGPHPRPGGNRGAL